MLKKIQNYINKKLGQLFELVLKKKYLLLLIPLIVMSLLVTVVHFIDINRKVNEVTEVVPQRYLYPVLRFGFYGLMNGLGKITVMPIYNFIENRAYKADLPIPVQFADGKNSQYGYINEKEEVVISPRYRLAAGFEDGVAKVFRNQKELDENKSIFINQDGQTVLGLNEYGVYSNGMVSVKTADGTYNYINLKNEVIIKDLIIDPSLEFGYSDEYLTVEKTLYNKFSKAMFTTDYDALGIHSEGLIAVVKDDKLGFVNVQGQIVIAPQYDLGIYDIYKDVDFPSLPNINLRLVKEQDRIEDFIFFDGLVRVRKDKKYHFINKKNEIVIENVGVEVKNIAKQRFYNNFSDGLAIKVVDKEGVKSCGYIDKTGKEIITPKFKNCNIFVGKLTINEENYIDRQGEAVNTFDYK